MAATEFAFLALGLVLGVASGAALVEVLRSRPPAPREVRVTVAPDSVPTRSSTLATDPFDPSIGGPAAWGPGDRRSVHRPATSVTAFATAFDMMPAAPRDRTQVPSSGRAAIPLAPGGGSSPGVGGPAPRPVGVAIVAATAVGGLPSTPPAASDRRPAGGIEVRPQADGIDRALRAAEARAALVLGGAGAAYAWPGGTAAGADDRTGTAETGGRSAVMTAVADPPERDPTTDPAPTDPTRAEAMVVLAADVVAHGRGDGEPTRSDAADTKPLVAGPCAELQAVAEDRCAVAARARDGATAARDALRDAQRTYDDHVSRAEEAAATADPRAIQRAKEAAQAAFRAARDGAPDREALDRAAAEWLASVNRINATTRQAATAASREQSAANELVLVIERLVLEADAARITAESAEEACLAARQAVADCQEREAVTPPLPVPPEPSREPGAGSRYPAEVPALTRDEPGEAPSDRDARILRILRGDGEALRRTVSELAGDDPTERSRWQFELTGLADAVMAQALEAGAIDVALDHPFWEPFTRTQCRDIVAALASLGYRFDGLSGFADGRVPSQRDLSLAVGYAGLDPMRIRIWPNETEMRGLYADASVAADEYLAGAAGGLTLGELVALLGPRADGLTDLWNDWGRVRPRLLATD